MRINLIAGLAAAIVFQAPAKDTEVRVFVSNGVKAVMEELQPQCERVIGHPLAIEFGATTVLKRRIEAGEAFDAACEELHDTGQSISTPMSHRSHGKC